MIVIIITLVTIAWVRTAILFFYSCSLLSSSNLSFSVSLSFFVRFSLPLLFCPTPLPFSSVCFSFLFSSLIFSFHLFSIPVRSHPLLPFVWYSYTFFSCLLSSILSLISSSAIFFLILSLICWEFPTFFHFFFVIRMKTQQAGVMWKRTGMCTARPAVCLSLSRTL